ncbi:MAG: 4-alpha-glucanotransferase [Coriobacteriales bacterium]|nr:4-alpha-glucanotransferase [Coriobacteriales bacterium]
MRAVHNTSDSTYRTPFGACPLGESVTLTIDVWDEQDPQGVVRLWVDGEGETLVPMEQTVLDKDGQRVVRLTGAITPQKTQIIWYYFAITADDGAVWRYGARNECSVGEGAFADGEPRSFQITVYEPREVKPMWYRHGVVYQIFPDRFYRGGEDWLALVEKSLTEGRNGPGRMLVHDWGTQPTYRKDQYGRISTWDFYGGNLDGVREKLGYLKSMGITAIYLNPIFEAASNHRYDTADYMRIDPMLGDKQTFVRLCEDAKRLGIAIILDGVFNHTGCDSRYFNKYGNYPEEGAFQSADSKYASWFKFGGDADQEYQCWWGVDDLPDVNENDPSYREFICGEDGVVRTWLRLGASGWRLDVADELPDDFIEDIKAAALAEKPDAVIIGEVWEDASHKVSYGELRRYLQGRELDGVMNYPFRTSLLDFLTNKTTAHQIASCMQELCENYPRDAFLSCLNLLGSHDRERLLTVLGNAPSKDELTDEQRRDFRLNEGQRSLAVSRLWVAALLQMTMPGVPCIYYGDEAGLEGYTDPYNRATYPWGAEDKNCRTIYRNAIAVRKSLPEVFEEGNFRPFALNDDVFGFTRTYNGQTVCVLANASLKHEHTVSVPMHGTNVEDIVQGKKPAIAGDGTSCSVHLWPLGTSVLYFHNDQRLQRPMERGMGVICHITSVPNNGQPGTMGEPAKRFVDVLAEAGQTYWQVLPVNPTDQFGSPYAGLSAFAGNPFLIDGLQTKFDKLIEGLDKDPGYAEFCKKNADWLEPYVMFRAIKETVGDDIPWQLWPENVRNYEPGIDADGTLEPLAETHRRSQYVFEKQWHELRRYANERGVKIIGDMPMYVSADSSDVWAERDIFALDEKGNPLGVAGCPPDNFAKDGQIWGNPTFRWDVLKERNYDWWMRRLERMLELYDYVRLDHFLGFSSYYNIPGGRGAMEGAWNFGPGLDLFRVAHERFGDLPFIGEDLGTITPAVRFLVATTGFPGMDVIQFANEDVRQGYTPVPGKICYTSTHDTQTLLGWIKSKWPYDDSQHVYRELVAKCLKSDADVVIMPLQDVLELDDSARMNVPGTAEGNWSWKAQESAVNVAQQYLVSLARDSGRWRA